MGFFRQTLLILKKVETRNIDLYRLRFLGKILAVERAKPVVPKGSNNKQNDHPLPSPSHPHGNVPEPQKLPFSMGNLDKGIATGGLRSEPIAPSLGVDYPFPPHLE